MLYKPVCGCSRRRHNGISSSLLLLASACMRILVELFFLQGGKEASHSCVVKAVARTNQVLLYSVSVQHISEALAGILAASVAVHIAPLRFEYLVCSCSTVAIQSSFFMLFCISRVTISPLNQFMMCEIYNFPSAHGNSEMLFKNFSSGAFAVKLRFMRFSSSCTSVVAFVIPCSMCRLCSSPLAFILNERSCRFVGCQVI